MKIRKLGASFGRLSGETLTLEDGLNIVHMDNEGGKSTWSAFILAMLYGIDTSERASLGKMPDKTRYKPWDGRAMEGFMEVETCGRSIRLERSSKGAAIMKQFSSMNLATGQDVGYNSETVGQELTGVSRDVYRRSAFIKQGTVKIDNSVDLEKRLLSMVTGGNEDTSYGEVKERLSQWSKSLKNRQGGEMAHLEEDERALDGKLETIGKLSSRLAQARGEFEALSKEKEAAQKELDVHLARESFNRGREIAKARMDVSKLETELKKLNGGHVPPARSRLMEIERKLQAAEETGKRLKEAQEVYTQAVARRKAFVPAVTVFNAMTDAQALEQIEKKRSEASSKGGAATAFLVLAIVFAVLGALSVVLLHQAGIGGGLFVLFAVFLVMGLATGTKRKKRRLQAESSLTEMTAQLALWREDRHVLAQLEEKTGEASAALASLNETYSSLEAQAIAYASGVLGGSGTLEEIRPVLDEKYSLLESYGELSAQYDAAVKYMDKISQGYQRDDGKYDLDSLPVPVTEKQEALDRLRDAERAWRECENSIFHLKGELSAAGDYDRLFAAREAKGIRKARMQAEYDAIELAIEKLDSANDELSMLFSPALNNKAGDYFKTLTGGRYEGIFLNREMEARARESGGVVNRDAGFLSAGAGDQLYLAVRLAICDLVLPTGADAPPIILDDVLGSFDDSRMGLAMELVKELSKKRQIILFTCQGREESYLKG